MKTFLLVDDHEIVRAGLKLLLSGFYPNACIYEAANGQAAKEDLKKNHVDLLILDVQLPDTNSFELMEYTRLHHPQVKVLVFSMSPESLYGKWFVKAGANGYLSKEAGVEEIKKAIETILSGYRYVSSRLMNEFVNSVAGNRQNNPFTGLSKRELEIASLLLTGASISEIGYRLHLQSSTVTTYKSRIYEKLAVSNLIELKELATIYQFSA